MTEGVTGRRRNLPPVARLVSTPSLSTTPATSASAGSPSRAVGTVEELASRSRSFLRPPQRVGLTRRGSLRLRGARHAGRHARVGPPAGPLGRGELLTASSSPHSYRKRLSVATATMILLWYGDATMTTTPTCHSNPLPCWPCRRSTTALAMDPRWRRCCAPQPSAS
jgi:hypothetical protein